MRITSGILDNSGCSSQSVRHLAIPIAAPQTIKPTIAVLKIFLFLSIPVYTARRFMQYHCEYSEAIQTVWVVMDYCRSNDN
jgi:hypothetical protein